MATIKQKKALDKVIENRGNVSRAMMDVGYQPATAKNPKNLTESIGWKELCLERGLTEDFLVKALVKDIEDKPGNRKSEIELGFKVIGRLSDRPEGNKTLIVVVSGESAKRYNVPITHQSEGSST